jgi:uncharacterized protein (TIGR04222 family)
MRRLVLLVAFLAFIPVSGFAKGYSAQRFDVSIRPMDDGAVQVTETVRFTFVGGPFTYVSRELALKKTDGIQVLGASMDGHVLPRGTDAGQFEVRTSSSRVTIRWHFAGASDSEHDFRLSYVARGVVQQTGGGPLLEWQAHPTEHPYRILSSRIVVDGFSPERAPAIRTRRVGDAREERNDTTWVVEARDIAPNGWVTVSSPTTMAAGIVPKWQDRERRRQAMAPRMLEIAGIITLLCLATVLLIWRQYPTPPMVDTTSTADRPPNDHPPAIAAAILAGGHSSQAHVPGTLFDLASRNAVSVAEAERTWKTRRNFVLTRNDGVPLAPHESTLLDLMFKGERSVTWSAAASRVARRGRAFRHEVNEELLRLGLTDEQRRANRRRLFAIGFFLIALSLAAMAIIVVMDAAPWGLAIPLGIDSAAVLALVLGATRAELSDEGFRERERWRGFRRSLKGSMGSKGSTGSMSSEGALRYLPYVAAMGLGVPLARYLKTHGAGTLPPWFRSLGGDDASGAFAAFIGSISASTSSGAAGSGAAGGGSSSAG